MLNCGDCHGLGGPLRFVVLHTYRLVRMGQGVNYHGEKHSQPVPAPLFCQWAHGKCANRLCVLVHMGYRMGRGNQTRNGFRPCRVRIRANNSRTTKADSSGSGGTRRHPRRHVPPLLAW